MAVEGIKLADESFGASPMDTTQPVVITGHDPNTGGLGIVPVPAGGASGDSGGETGGGGGGSTTTTSGPHTAAGIDFANHHFNAAGTTGHNADIVSSVVKDQLASLYDAAESNQQYVVYGPHGDSVTAQQVLYDIESLIVTFTHDDSATGAGATGTSTSSTGGTILIDPDNQNIVNSMNETGSDHQAYQNFVLNHELGHILEVDTSINASHGGTYDAEGSANHWGSSLAALSGEQWPSDAPGGFVG